MKLPMRSSRCSSGTLIPKRLTMSTDGTIEKVKINGVDAVLVNGKGLDWEANGVLYGVTSASLDKNDLIKVAESIR